MVVVTQPRVRVCDPLRESGNDSPCKSRHFPGILPMFPKQISVTSLAVIASINATSHQNALYALCSSYGINTHKKAPDAV
jgi:hypothetical protein